MNDNYDGILMQSQTQKDTSFAHDLFYVDFRHLSISHYCMQALQRVLLSCMYTTLDYAQTGLIAAVFVFKVSVSLMFLVSNYQ